MLALLHGKALIAHVIERVSKATMPTELILTTDDPRIASIGERYGIQTILSGSDLQTGSERCADAAIRLNLKDSIIINVQGDEPLIDPKMIDRLAIELLKGHCEIATATSPIESEEDWLSPHVVKVARTGTGHALYFSRAPIPFLRNKSWANQVRFRHIGIYGFAPGILTELIKLKATPLEQCESLEQLRWLENGYKIQCIETDSVSPGVDVPEDLNKIEKIMRSEKRRAD